MLLEVQVMQVVSSHLAILSLFAVLSPAVTTFSELSPGEIRQTTESELLEIVAYEPIEESIEGETLKRRFAVAVRSRSQTALRHVYIDLNGMPAHVQSVGSPLYLEDLLPSESRESASNLEIEVDLRLQPACDLRLIWRVRAVLPDETEVEEELEVIECLTYPR
jgi:hypothetical protein